MGNSSALQGTQGRAVLSLISGPSRRQHPKEEWGRPGTQRPLRPGVPSPCAAAVTKCEPRVSDGGFTASCPHPALEQQPSAPCVWAVVAAPVSLPSLLSHPCSPRAQCDRVSPLPTPQHHRPAQIYFSILLLLFDNSYPCHTVAFYPTDTCAPVGGIAPKVCPPLSSLLCSSCFKIQCTLYSLGRGPLLPTPG